MDTRTFNKEKFERVIAHTVAELKRLSTVKGDEYAHGDDRLDNFRRGANKLGVPMEVIWSIYAGKHMDAIDTWINDLVEDRDRPRSEPIVGRIDDLIVYLVLLKAIYMEREGIEYLKHASASDAEPNLSGVRLTGVSLTGLIDEGSTYITISKNSSLFKALQDTGILDCVQRRSKWDDVLAGTGERSIPRYPEDDPPTGGVEEPKTSYAPPSADFVVPDHLNPFKA